MSKNLNKTDLAKGMNVPGLSGTMAEKVVEAVFDGIAGALAQGNDVKITGFGTFKVKTRAAREGRNPRTGEPAPIPARKAIVFSAGDKLKKGVQ
jgi:nucleoid DNA-binding protein